MWLKTFKQNLVFRDVKFATAKIGTKYVKFNAIPKDKRYKKRYFMFSNLYNEDEEKFLHNCKELAAAAFYWPFQRDKIIFRY